MEFEYGRAVCYSGYRTGQSPAAGIHPSEAQIREDLGIILEAGFKYIRMYDATEYARSVCKVIREDGLPLGLMLGPGLVNEVNNTGCAWNKTVYTREQLAERAARNDGRVNALAEIAVEYGDVVFCVSVGNENTPDWGENTVSESRLIEFAERLKRRTGKPVTFNEGAREWRRLGELARHMDIICIHSYPLWYGNTVEEALAANQGDFEGVRRMYPGKAVWFSEVGWATRSSGTDGQMKAGQTSEENQAAYYKGFWDWVDREEIISFVFEAFDEPWKGSADSDDAEKHWGIFNVDRSPKPMARNLLGCPGFVP